MNYSICSMHYSKGGTVASWLVHSFLERTVWVRALAGVTVLCSWARHLTLTVPLSTQEYKWVPANCWGNLTNCRGVTSIPSRGSRNTPSRVMLQKPGQALAAMCHSAPRLHFSSLHDSKLYHFRTT